MTSDLITLSVCTSAGGIVLLCLSWLLRDAARQGTVEDRQTSRKLICGLLAWATIAVSTAYWGTLNFTTFLPFALIPIIIGTIVSYHPAVASLLTKVSLHRLVFLQTYRIAGFIFVYLYYATGDLSRGFALNAGWGDVLTGVLAVPVGWMLLKKMRGAGAALIVWCLIGIGDLILAPASAGIYGAESLVNFPLNTIPLFLGPPLGILLHIYTLRIFQVSGLRRDNVSFISMEARS